MSGLVLTPSLNVPQAQFLALPHKFRLFVAGFGSGKTWVGGAGQSKHFWEHPKTQLGYFAPTYSQIRDIYYPTFEEVAYNWGLGTKVRVGDHEIDVYSSGMTRYRGTIICRSLEKPETIIGFKIARGLVDELDVMKPKKAETAWRKMIARLRQKYDGINGLDVTTTPEGFRFVYDQWVKAVREKHELGRLYGMVQASTYDNEANLPDDYIDSLVQSYPPQLIAAYLRGEFVNLTSGAVYPNFDRRRNHTNARIQPGEVLHIGLDFNVMNMTATANVIRDGNPMTLAELTKIADTPTMARRLIETFPGHELILYPDVSGQNTSSKKAGESDFTILRQHGLRIEVGKVNENGNAAANPVRDRYNAFNAMILNEQGKRRYRINTDACPVATEALEKQVFGVDGTPDKTTGHDHPNDATGYFMVRRYPIVKPVFNLNIGAATHG